MRVARERGKWRAASLVLVLLLAHLLLLLLLLLLLRPDHLPPASATAGDAAAATAAAPSAAPPTRILGNPRARESPCVGVSTGKTWAWQPVYTVVIDAGDTATRTHVFSFLRCCLDNTFLLQKEHYFQVNDTVLNYVAAPHQMRFLLLPLLRRARSLVPEPYLPYTPLLLRATPSLRRLPRVYATRLIYRARKIVARTAFLVKREEVTIMAGHDEAADLWLAANFLTGRLYQNDSLPFATANLGGGTLQVTIPLPGQPEHIKRTINQKRKGGGVNQSGVRSKEHGGGVAGSSAHLGGKQDAPGVDLAATSKNTHRWKTSDKATSDNRSSGGGESGGGGGGGGGGGRAGGTRTQGRGRGGIRRGFAVYKGNQSQSEHVQKRGRVDASTGHRDTSDSAQTPRRESRRRHSWKGFRGPFLKPRNRGVNPRKRVNNSVVIVPQNASDRSGAGGKKLRKPNSEPNRTFRAQHTGWESNSRRKITGTGRNTEENKARRMNDNVRRRRDRKTHRNQEEKSKDNNVPGSRRGTRRKDNKTEENEVGEQTEKKHRHGHGEGRTPIAENAKSSIGNAKGTRTKLSRKRDNLNTETQGTKSTTDSTLHHTSNTDKRVTSGASYGRRVDLMASRSHRLRPPRRRKHPRRHRQRNQKKPTRRKRINSNNGTQSEYRNEESNVSGQQKQSSPASRSPLLPAERRQVGTLERASSDQEHHQNRSHVALIQTTHSAEAQNHGHRSVLHEGQRKVNVTRRRNFRTQDKASKSITTNSQTTRQEKTDVSKSSLSGVTDSFATDKTANESLANGSGQIDKRGEEVGGEGKRRTVTSHRERKTNKKEMKNSHNTTLQGRRNTEEVNTSTIENYSRRRGRRRKFSNERRRKAWILRRKRLEQERRLLHNKENTPHFISVLGASLSDNPHEANKTLSVEESRRADREEAERLSVGEVIDAPLPQVSGNRQVNNKIQQHTTRFDPSFSSSDTQTSPPTVASHLPENKNHLRLMSRRDRRRQRQRMARVQFHATDSKHASLGVNAHIAVNQSQDTYQRNKSGLLQSVQEETSHRLRHNHGGRRPNRRRYRHRRRRRHYQRKENVRGRRSVEEVKHNALYRLNRLLPPGEERESVRWRKNDQRNRRELADPFLVVGDWRDSLRRSYFGTPFPWQNTQESWRRLMPRRDAERSSQKEAGNFRQNVGSERPVDTPLRTEIRGSSAKEFQKASRFLRRRRSVSKLAWETKAKMKAKRQNLAVALSQRCGRTSAGLLRSCGEPEMNCQPGEGDSRQAEMVEGKCNHLSLAGNQSAPAERESPPREDRSSKRYLQQIEDTALVMVTDGGGEDGGGYQRRRRELGNLSQTPNVTYRCSPYHKYWLFASSMPMGLYPLRVKILQSGNLTRIVPTSQESRPHEITTESPTTTQRPPTTPTPHHRADIPPEEEDYIDKDEEEDPSQYPENPSTPSSIPPTHPTTSVHSTLPSTTQQPLSSSRPPYTTVRVTNKWVEETLAKVKTVVDSILKSIGSARSNVEENSSSKKTPDQDGVNESKEGSEKRMERRKDIKGERENGRKRGEEGEKEKERNSDRQGQARDDRERGTRKEGIEMGRLGKKRSRERNRKGKSEGNKRRTERRESQITLESSEDQEADGREGERNGRGENTESLRNEHNNRERRKLGRRRNAPRNKTENNRSFPDSGNEGSESEFSNNTVSQESDRIPGTWKQKAGGAALSPPNRVSELSGADESVSSSEEDGEKDAAARNTEFGIETETLPVPLSVVSQGGGVTRSESDRHLIKKSEGTNYPPDTNVRTESPATSSPRDNRNRDEHVVSLEASTSLPTKISSSIDSGNNGNDTTGDSGAPASKQTISSVTDLLFTVPNERVIKPAQNSQVQSEIKSTEKLIRTSLEGLLFRVPPGGTTSTISSSKQSQEEKSSLIASENSQTATTTTAVPDATTPMREVTRLDSTEAPSVDAETIVAGSKPAHRQRSEERRRKKISGAEGTQNPVYQRLNATENESRQPDRVEEKEQEEEEEGELILRTACLPVGSIGRFKVEGVTYLVTGMGAGPGAEDCWREVTNVVNRHIRLPALNQTTLLATTAFYFVAASANLIEPEMTYGFVRVEQFRLAANVMCAREPRLLPDPLACLDYQYVAALLTQGLHLSDDTEVLVCDKIQGFRVGWALGAALDYLQNH